MIPVTDPHRPGLEDHIAAWRAFVQGQPSVTDADVDELERRLRGGATDLLAAGLSADEAFLVALRRTARGDGTTREFAREHGSRLWTQLVLGPETAAEGPRGARDAIAALACAVAAAVVVKVPTAFGLDLTDDPEFYLRNLGLFALPFLVVFLAWTRRLHGAVVGWLVLAFVVAALAANAYPLTGQTAVLTAIHLPVALWAVVGLAHAGGDWRSPPRRMGFVRFTGEWFIYYVLFALGGGVLTAVTAGAFSAIGVDVAPFLSEWLLPCGAVGAVVVAAWLVEARQGVVQNLAPVLATVFTPLFAAMLLAFLAAVALTGGGIDLERELLILFDLLLVLVLGLLLYAVSARDPQVPPGLSDRLQLLLVSSALLVDLLVLAAMVSRTSAFGFSPNKTASLGLNLVLLANLVWSARASWRFVRGRAPWTALEGWQLRYLPVLAAWAAVVAVLFPPLFDFA